MDSISDIVVDPTADCGNVLSTRKVVRRVCHSDLRIQRYVIWGPVYRPQLILLGIIDERMISYR